MCYPCPMFNYDETLATLKDQFKNFQAYDPQYDEALSRDGLLGMLRGEDMSEKDIESINEAESYGIRESLDGALDDVERRLDAEDRDEFNDRREDLYEDAREYLEETGDMSWINDLADNTISELGPLTWTFVGEDDTSELSELWTDIPAYAEYLVKRLGIGDAKEIENCLYDVPSDMYWAALAANVDSYQGKVIMSGPKTAVFHDPELVIGNFLFTGGVWNVQLAGEVEVPVSELRSDREAFAYTMDDIYGGFTTDATITFKED